MIKAAKPIIALSPLRLLLAGALMLSASPAVLAQSLIPNDFFNQSRDVGAPSTVEAGTLTFDGPNETITASGDVLLSQDGFTLTGESLVYNRQTGELTFVGAVSIEDPSGNRVEAANLEVTGGLRQAFIDSLTITTYDGAKITADSVEYDDAVQTMLVNATYAPCGDCIDDDGRRIGWSVRADTITYNAEDRSVYLEQPSLALLGVPVAWLPFLRLPDTSQGALDRIPLPTVDYSDQFGVKVAATVSAYSTRWTDIAFTPTLLTRQGFLLGAEWDQRFEGGEFEIKASGLRQFDQDAFEGRVGDREWRGAFQTSGTFRPVEEWQVGWSYTGFTDPAYFRDYRLDRSGTNVNQLFATHVGEQTFFDARIQRFNRLGEISEQTQGQQGSTLPVVRLEHIEDLGPDLGRIEISAKLLGVNRRFDSRTDANGVPYVFGYEGNKQHASVQAGWQKQWIGAGGLVATPYLGGRADFAAYDGASDLLGGETTLLSATPIAAMDVRYPLAASQGATVHLVEPIGQLVYRGSDTTAVGITNDDAQSFVLDDTNLFSFNRFSGRDRQETGLRANLGGRYQINFADGSYFELLAGQSFQLAGSNSFAAPNQTNTGLGSGLDDAASFAVLGAYGTLVPSLTAGGKVQLDSATGEIMRAGLDGEFAQDGYAAALTYSFIAANEARGVLDDQHEIGASLAVPVAEYWTVQANGYWDLAANTWIRVGGGVTYDDGYLEIGASASTTPDNDTRIMATTRLKAPAGLDVGFSGRVPGF